MNYNISQERAIRDKLPSPSIKENISLCFILAREPVCCKSALQYVWENAIITIISIYSNDEKEEK